MELEGHFLSYLHTRRILQSTCRLHACCIRRTRSWTVWRRPPPACRLHVDRKIHLEWTCSFTAYFTVVIFYAIQLQTIKWSARTYLWGKL